MAPNFIAWSWIDKRNHDLCRESIIIIIGRFWSIRERVIANNLLEWTNWEGKWNCDVARIITELSFESLWFRTNFSSNYCNYGCERVETRRWCGTQIPNGRMAAADPQKVQLIRFQQNSNVHSCILSAFSSFSALSALSTQLQQLCRFFIAKPTHPPQKSNDSEVQSRPFDFNHSKHFRP